MALSNTVGYVCSRALELSQLDSGFNTLAHQYYNSVLRQVATDTDWPYYRIQGADVPLLAGQKVYDLPDDYNRSDTCYLIDQYNIKTAIIIVSKYKFDRLTSPNVSGMPNIAYIDTQNNQIVFNTSVSQPCAYQLTYFRQPIETDEGGADDAEVIDFQNPMYLIYKIAAMMMDYNDDERANDFHAKADALFHKDRLNSYDEDNDSTIELGPSFRPGSRPSRSGYWWGFNWFD